MPAKEPLRYTQPALLCDCRWQAEIMKARRDLTHLMTLECGKPLAEACAEFDKG